MTSFVPLGSARTLKVCSDPNNLPFSDEKRAGFENRIAALVAGDLHASVDYVWWSERKNFVDKTLKAGKCDVVIGLPSGFPGVLTTRPYYESSYVFVYPKTRPIQLRRLSDPRLSNLRIGVHVVDANYAPPAQILARNGAAAHITGYSLFGPYGEPNPAAKLIDAVARGEVDVAIAWGPLAGYFAQQRGLVVQRIDSPLADRTVPLAFGISMAVRPSDSKLRNELQRILDRNSSELNGILDAYGVPRLAVPRT